MAFDLTLTFTGLNLFVPGRDRIDSLLPVTPPSMPHVAVLRWETKYLGGGGGDVVYQEQVLQGWSLDLTGLEGQDGMMSLPPGLVDAGAAVGRRIPARQLGPNPDDTVAARVSLPPPTVMTRANGGFWDLGPQMDVEMTHLVEWTLRGVAGDVLRWGMYSLHGFRAQALPDLYPVDGRIEVEVLHLPDDDVPADPPCGTPAHHFSAYYPLFGTGVEGPLPLFRAPPLEHPCEVLGDVVPGVAMGSFYTCMMAMSTATGP